MKNNYNNKLLLDDYLLKQDSAVEIIANSNDDDLQATVFRL